MHLTFIKKILKHYNRKLTNICETLGLNYSKLTYALRSEDIMIKKVTQLMDAAGLDCEFAIIKDMDDEKYQELASRWERPGATQDRRMGAILDLKKEKMTFKSIAGMMGYAPTTLSTEVKERDNCYLSRLLQLSDNLGRTLICRTRPKGSGDAQITVEFLS